jgi:hypothetical protein
MLVVIQNFWDVALWRLKTIGVGEGFGAPGTQYTHITSGRGNTSWGKITNCQQNQKEILKYNSLVRNWLPYFTHTRKYHYSRWLVQNLLATVTSDKHSTTQYHISWRNTHIHTRDYTALHDENTFASRVTVSCLFTHSKWTLYYRRSLSTDAVTSWSAGCKLPIK